MVEKKYESDHNSVPCHSMCFTAYAIRIYLGGIKMIYETANAYYFRSLIRIGGIESHLYYIAQKYGKYDITVFFRDADAKQLARLRRYVRCVKLLPDDKVICENLFCCFNREILDQCTAKNKYLVLHGDYYDMVKRGQMDISNIPKDDRIDKYLGVSQHVCKTWKEVSGMDAELIGEPVVLPKERPLLLLSATRLSAEKGWNRMQILAKEMDKAKIAHEWFVYTNSPQEHQFQHIHFREPTLGITGMMQMFDAYVQLSDNEGYCLSVVEALLQGIPCIVTDCPVFKEIGLTEGNSVTLSHDMHDIPLDAISNIRKLRGFKYRQPKDYWNKYLSHNKSTYKQMVYLVQATDGWEQHNVLDSELDVIHEEGDRWVIDSERYQTLIDFEKSTGKKLIDVIEVDE